MTSMNLGDLFLFIYTEKYVLTSGVPTGITLEYFLEH